MSDNQEDGFTVPILEAPPADAPAIGGPVGALFADEQMANAASKLSALEAMVALLTRDLKFDDFMREVLLIFMKVVKSEAGSIFELDYQNRIMFFRSCVGTSSDRLVDIKIPFGQGIVGHVAESKNPVTVDNVEENRMHLKAIQDAVGFQTRNIVAVPIIIRGRVFAVLELLNRVGESDYSPSDVEFLIQLCASAASIIEVRLMLGYALQAQVKAQAGKKDAA